ncbi:SIMPL domain-containing protein [Altererythrobacter sp.]|uniref:SIMPL domain-containing protein n=1 Tax=Altererythrobacter sp. TaxID=1872480 RepID=UPI003CFC5873
MIRTAIPAATLAMLASPAAAAEVRIEAQNPVVELTVSEVVQSAPDVAQIGAGVTTRAATAQEAVRQNAQEMDRLVTRMKALGIKPKDIQTSNFSLNPQYRYDRTNEQQVFTGYQVSNQVSVKLRELKRAGEVLDAFAGAGATNIFGPNFMLEDDSEVKATARGTAFKRGRMMAEEYARMAGYSGVRLLEVSETFQSYGRPQPLMAMRVAADAAEAATPIELGEVGTGVTISVKYEMQ